MKYGAGSEDNNRGRKKKMGKKVNKRNRME